MATAALTGSTYFVDNRVKKNPERSVPEAERRRIGRVVHDERGNASVSWRDAPADHPRPVLEILGEAKLSVKTEQSFDPYSRGGGHRELRPPTARTTRTDLRKLSEHIKLMRALEERRRNGGGED
jgi:hypothetical protein